MSSGLLLHGRSGGAHCLRMSATRILWGQLLLASLAVLGFVWAATGWTAWRLAYQPQLAPAWFMIWHWPIYQPAAFFIWWFKFDAYASGIFMQGACIAASGGIAAMVIAMVLSIWRAREAQHVTTYGSACWARMPGRFGVRGFLDRTVSCSVVLAVAICGTTIRNVCCALRQPARARAWDLSSRHC